MRQALSKMATQNSVRTFYLPGGIIALLFLSLALLTSCTSGAAPAPTATPVPTATSAPTQGLVGSWTSTVTKEDILRIVPGFPQADLCDNSGTFVWKFDVAGTFTIDQTALAGCPTPGNTHVEDKWSADGNRVTFAKGTPDEEVYEWSVQGDTLTLKYVSGNCVPCKAVNTANPWKRTGASSTP